MDQTTTSTATTMDSITTAITDTAQRDPWAVLLNAGSDPTLLFLLIAPVSLLLVVAIVYAIIIAFKNRRDRKELASAMALEEAEATRSNGSNSLSFDLETGVSPSQAQLTDLQAATTGRHLRIVKTKEAQVASEDLELTELKQIDRQSWLSRLKAGLSKTRSSLQKGLESIFIGKTKIDAEILEKLHELLYRADVGAQTADKLVDKVRSTLGQQQAADWNSVAQCIRAEAQTILEQANSPIARSHVKPWVILVVGVNGVGKTTTIGKLAAHFLAENKKVLLGAADTFRAAAIEQLSIWGERLGIDVIRHKAGADPAAVAYDTIKAALARQVDVVLIDTAGRLHSRHELMDELGKINRSIGKDLPGAPHETWLVIDATTGQNAVAQVKAFSDVVKLSGLIVTKLDGTAKGGVIVGIADQFKLPIHYVGVGEKAADLRQFNASDFSESLV